MLASLISRRNTQQDAPAPEQQPEPTAAVVDNTIARFLTQGGAIVRMYPTRFTTRWAGGPPFAAAKPYEVSGFQWKCDGCGAYGREGDTYKDPNYRDQTEARTEANEHADTCRAMPQPTA